jgi:EmrB/QacA subfamily drug resistance transporter
VLGPALGGLLIGIASWRWIFWINIPVGIAAVITGLRNLPRTATEEAGPIDVRGLVLLAVGLPALVYGLAELGQGQGADPARVLAPVIGGLLLITAFVVHALRTVRPILDVRLFANRAFAAAATTTFVLGGGLFGAMILMPLFFQTVHGESAAMTGLLVAPQGLGAAIAMPIAGRLTDRYGGGAIALVGTVIITATTVPFMLIDESTSFLTTSLAMTARGIGMGIAIMPAMTAAYAVLRRDQIADATPQLNVLQRVGGSLGIALFAVILERQLRTGGAGSPHAIAQAYEVTYRWVAAGTAVAILPALALLRVERREPPPSSRAA